MLQIATDACRHQDIRGRFELAVLDPGHEPVVRRTVALSSESIGWTSCLSVPPWPASRL